MRCVSHPKHKSNKSLLALTAVSAAGLLAAASPAQAAVITYVDALMNTDGWRSTTVAKPVGTDANGDVALGSDGYMTVQNPTGTPWTISSLPSYISTAAMTANYTINGWGYFGGPVNLDDPTLAIAPTVTNYEGDATRSSGTPAPQFSFTVNSSVPASFLLTVISDTTTADAGEGYRFTSKEINVAGPGDSETITSLPINGTPDFYVFKIDGAVAGDVFTVKSLANVLTDGAQLHGIAWEAVPEIPPVPEPASLSILALGGLALLARHRRA